MAYTDLITKVLAIVQEPEETTLERFLQTMKDLPEPEDELDAALRRMLIDLAVAEYLGNCRCGGEFAEAAGIE